MGRMVDRTHRELTDEDIARIADTYAWRALGSAGPVPSPLSHAGAWRSQVLRHPWLLQERDAGGDPQACHVLTPGRYVGAEAQEDDGEPFEEKMQRLTATLREQQAEAAKHDAAIAANLKELGMAGAVSLLNVPGFSFNKAAAYLTIVE